MNPIARVSNVKDGNVEYQAIWIVCPGCKEWGGSGLHMLPVSDTQGKRPQWGYDGNLAAPTLSPSIMTGRDTDQQCHSYFQGGVWVFLDDCTHSLVGQRVPAPPLEDWML